MRPTLFIVDPRLKKRQKNVHVRQRWFLGHELPWADSMMGNQPSVFHVQAQQCFFIGRRWPYKLACGFTQRGVNKGMEMEGATYYIMLDPTMLSPLEHLQPIPQTPDVVGPIELLIFHVAMASKLLRRLMDCAETLEDAKDKHKMCVQGKHSQMECRHVHESAHNIVVISHLESHYPYVYI